MATENLDFSGIRNYLQKNKNWSIKKINRAEKNYKKFLQQHSDNKKILLTFT